MRSVETFHAHELISDGVGISAIAIAGTETPKNSRLQEKGKTG
jgi:hypothetical protein